MGASSSGSDPMDYNYILLADSRFVSYAVSELRQALAVTERLKTMALGRGIYLARLDIVPETSFESLRHATFSYGIVPIVDIVEGQQTDDQLGERAVKTLSKEETFRLEVVSLGAKRGKSAKDSEVKIGKALESLGFRVSLASPERIVYVIVGEGIAVIASAKASQLADITFDHFRLENKDRDILNRAEVKMKEAFDTFGISDEKIESCIDVGASPGGWTNFMVKRGARVVAIDKAALDYDRLATRDVKVIDSADGYEGGHSVLHIKMNLPEECSLPLEENSFDMLAIDMNTDYLESSKTAVALSRHLKHGGIMIMTLKLPKISDAGKIYMVNDALGKEYKVERIKKLHHNRMELTLFARRL